MACNLYPIRIHFKKYILVYLFQQNLINQLPSNKIAVFPPVIVESELQPIVLRDLVRIIVDLDQFTGTLKRTISFVLRPAVPDHSSAIESLRRIDHLLLQIAHGKFNMTGR